MDRGAVATEGAVAPVGAAAHVDAFEWAAREFVTGEDVEFALGVAGVGDALGVGEEERVEQRGGFVEGAGFALEAFEEREAVFGDEVVGGGVKREAPGAREVGDEFEFVAAGGEFLVIGTGAVKRSGENRADFVADGHGGRRRDAGVGLVVVVAGEVRLEAAAKKGEAGGHVGAFTGGMDCLEPTVNKSLPSPREMRKDWARL